MSPSYFVSNPPIAASANHSVHVHAIFIACLLRHSHVQKILPSTPLSHTLITLSLLSAFQTHAPFSRCVILLLYSHLSSSRLFKFTHVLQIIQYVRRVIATVLALQLMHQCTSPCSLKYNSNGIVIWFIVVPDSTKACRSEVDGSSKKSAKM